MLHSTDPDRLSSQESSVRDTWICLGKGTEQRLMCSLGVGGDRNGKYQIRVGGMERESMGKDNWNLEAFGG